MFKIKKNPRKFNHREPLAETHNAPSTTSIGKFQGRPLSVKMSQRHISQQVICNRRDQQLEESSNHTNVQQQFSDNRLLDRNEFEQNVRKLSVAIFKDRMTLLGEFKEELIKRITQRTFFRPEVMEEDWTDFLRPLIVRQMERLQNAKALELKFEERANRIGNMFDQRLQILSNFR